jgi:hypothetical protein
MGVGLVACISYVSLTFDASKIQSLLVWVQHNKLQGSVAFLVRRLAQQGGSVACERVAPALRRPAAESAPRPHPARLPARPTCLQAIYTLGVVLMFPAMVSSPPHLPPGRCPARCRRPPARPPARPPPQGAASQTHPAGAPGAAHLPFPAIIPPHPIFHRCSRAGDGHGRGRRVWLGCGRRARVAGQQHRPGRCVCGRALPAARPGADLPHAPVPQVASHRQASPPGWDEGMCGVAGLVAVCVCEEGHRLCVCVCACVCVYVWRWGCA